MRLRLLMVLAVSILSFSVTYADKKLELPAPKPSEPKVRIKISGIIQAPPSIPFTFTSSSYAVVTLMEAGKKNKQAIFAEQIVPSVRWFPIHFSMVCDLDKSVAEKAGGRYQLMARVHRLGDGTLQPGDLQSKTPVEVRGPVIETLLEVLPVQ